MAQNLIGSIFLDFRAGVASFNNDLRMIKKSLDTTARDMEKAGKNLGTALTAPILAAGAGMLKAADNYQKAQRTIAVGTGATGKVLQSLNKDFQDVARTVPNALGDTAKAMSEVYTRTGQTGEANKTLSKTFLNLAEITGEDLNTSLRSGLQLFQSWGVTQEQQIETMDMFFRASQASGVGVNQLMETVKGADDVLQPYGVSLETATTWMAAFEKAAVDNETVLGGLQKALAGFVKAGVTDLPGALAQSIDSIRNAKTTTEGLSMAMNIFGKKSGPEMFDAIRNGQVDLKAFNDEIINGQNTIQGSTEANRTFFGQLSVFANDLNISMASAGQVLADSLTKMLPAIKSVVEGIALLVKKFSELSPETQKLILGFAAFAAALGPVLMWMAKIVSFGGQLVGWLRNTLTALAGTSKELGLAQKLWSGLSATWNAITGVGAKVASVLGQVIGWLTSGAPIATAMGAALSVLSGIFAGLSAMALAAGGDIKLFLEGFVELFWDAVAKVQELWGSLTEYLSSAWGEFSSWFTTSINNLLSVIDTWLQGIGVNIPKVWQATVTFISGLWEKFVGWFAEKLDAISAKWEGVVHNFRAGMFELGKILGNDAWQKWALDSEAAAQKAKAGIVENKLVLEQTIPVVTELAKAGDGVTASMNKVTDAHNRGGAAGGRNLNLVNNLLKGTKDEADKANEAVKKMWESLADKKAQQAIDGLKEGFDNAATKGQLVSDQQLQELEDKLTEQYKESAKQSGAALTQELEEAARASAKNDVSVYKKEVIEKKIQADKEAHTKTVGFFKGLMEDAITGTRFDWVEQGKKAAIEIAAEWATRLLEANIFGASSFGDAFSIIIQSLGGALDGWAGSIIEMLGGTITNSATSIATDVATNAATSAATNYAADAVTGAATAGTAYASSGTAAMSSYASMAAAAAPYLGVALAAYFGFQGTKETIDRIKNPKGDPNNDFEISKYDQRRGASLAFSPHSQIAFGFNDWTGWASDDTAIRDGAIVDPGIRMMLIAEAMGLDLSFGGNSQHAKEKRRRKAEIEAANQRKFIEDGEFDLFGGGKSGLYANGPKANYNVSPDIDPRLIQFGNLLSVSTIGEINDQFVGMWANAISGAETFSGQMLTVASMLANAGMSAEETGNAIVQAALDGSISIEDMNKALEGLALISTNDLPSVEEGLLLIGDTANGPIKSQIKALELTFHELAQSGISSSQGVIDFFTNRFGPESGAAIQKMAESGIDLFGDFSQLTYQQMQVLINIIGDLSNKVREDLGGAFASLPEEVNVDVNINKNITGGGDETLTGAAKGGIVKFARGGVVNFPTLFPTSSGLGMMGEAGPEAIMPLTKINGKLGVATSAGNSGNIVIQIDASGAQAGVEHRIMGVLQTMRESIIQDAVEIAAYQSQRN